MIKIISSSNETLVILDNVLNTIISEGLNREFTFDFSAVIDNDKSNFLTYLNKVEVENNYFNMVYLKKNRTQDAITFDIQCEHVSYDLLTANFTAGFTATGAFSAMATTILAGTGFTVGTIQITGNQTYSNNQKTNARQILFDLAVLFGGELEFSKYQVNLLTQRGANRGVQFRYRKNLSTATQITDARQKINGLPRLSYDVSVAELEFEQGFIANGANTNEHYELGDTIQVIDDDLGLNIPLRIIKDSHNTEFHMQGVVEISNFVQDVADTVTQIQTTSVAKNNVYNGCSIGPTDGFVAERSDQLAKTSMNATNGIEIDLRNSITASYSAVFFVQIDTATGTAKLFLSGNAEFTGIVRGSQIIGGSIIIGSGSNTFNANSTNGIWLGSSAFSTAPFNVTLSGALTATSAIINGHFTSKSSAGTTLMDVFQDTNGGEIQVYDNSGNLNVRTGVESGAGVNTGGTFILYNDGATKSRVALGIDKVNDIGLLQLLDTNGIVRAGMNESSGIPKVYVNDTAGSTASWLTPTTGVINGDTIATQAWVTANFVHL